VVFINRQEIFQDVSLFTNQPKAKFYDKLFLNLDLSAVKSANIGRPSPRQALLCAFIVMKCEAFAYITDLHDYLSNNLIIAHFCGFDITKPLPSYWTFERFIKNIDNEILKLVMRSQVLQLAALGIIDPSFIGLDSTPNMANTKQNNPKSFSKNKFKKSNRPKSDKHCRLGVHTASNQHNENNYDFYWGYKNHVLCDCITGLPIYELTTPANIADSAVALSILESTHSFLPLDECTFIGDKGYDVKEIYNTVKEKYHGDCVIPVNSRNTKDPKKLPNDRLLCPAGLAMHKDGRSYDRNRTRQKFCCPYKNSKKEICPCEHKNWNNGKKNRGCVKYVTIPDDYRLSIDRQSVEFKSVYALRTEAERYNSRFKSTGQERLWVRDERSAQNLNTVAHISLLAIALAAVITKSGISYRSFKSMKRIA
jgi:hypothetical protein